MTEIPLPWLNPPLSGNRVRGNPFVAAKKTETALEQARWAIKAKCHHAYDEQAPVEVELHFRVKDYRRRDADNLYPTLKVVQDALVQEGVLLDDGWQHVRRASVEIHEPNGEAPAMWLVIRRWHTAPEIGSVSYRGKP